MVCQNCGANEAVVHLTRVVDNQATTLHLCERCAAEKGVEAAQSVANLPLADFLAQMRKASAEEGLGPAEDPVCPFCDLTLSEFREIGRLGCPQCYSTFESHLRGLLRRIHGGTSHVGKVYLPPDSTATDRFRQLEALRRKLQRAVATEDFERAADLRDQIRALEPQG